MPDTPTLCTEDAQIAELICSNGFMRLVLSQSYASANVMTTAPGASSEMKRRWSIRAARIKALLDQLPAPENPRDPYDDIPGEPTPEEADAAWQARAAAEDAREAARRVPPGPTPKSTVPVPRSPTPPPPTIEIEDFL